MILDGLHKMPANAVIDPASIERIYRGKRFRSAGWVSIFVSAAFLIVSRIASVSPGVTAWVCGTLVMVAAFLFGWTRVWIRESKEPFKYTFSVAEFTPAPGPPATMPTAGPGNPMDWLARDLIEKLGERVGRLSLLNEPDEQREEKPDGLPTSHVHVSGWHGVRPTEDGQWMLEVVPEVRLGFNDAPAKLAQTVRFRLGRGIGETTAPEIDDRNYRRLFERVYWSVASEIYAQIRRGVDQKVNLLPPGRLRAAAYLHEADDYASSNTLDAFEAARRLYRRSLEIYDVASREPAATPWRRRFRRWRLRFDEKRCEFRAWRTGILRHSGRREILTARAELGYARTLVAEWHLRMLCGTSPTELYEGAPKVKRAIERLEAIPTDVPEQRETLFRAHVIQATTSALLDDWTNGAEALGAAEQLLPVTAREDAEFLFASGMIELDPLRSLRLLGQAVDLDPALERAHFHRALQYEAIWRRRETLEPDIAEAIDREYSAVISINPGNISAWASRGYIGWLLADSPADPESPRERKSGDDWRDQAINVLEAGRQYKEVRRDAMVAELDWNLTRLFAEKGEFAKAYSHYIQAVSAMLDEPRLKFLDHFYKDVTPAVVDRYDHYARQVDEHVQAAEQHVPETEVRLIKSVKAFVLNDCGLLYQAHYNRCGVRRDLLRAREAYKDAARENEAFVLPTLNLAGLSQLEAELAQDEDMAAEHRRIAVSLLQEVLRREPDCVPAQLQMVELTARLSTWSTEKQHALEGENIARLAGAEQDGKTSSRDSPSPTPDIPTLIGRLEADRKGNHAALCAELRRLLPHSYFDANDDGSVLDIDGTHVDALLGDSTIRWTRDFTEIHVEALIQWGMVMAQTSPGAAESLCTKLRSDYCNANPQLLGAHLIAALVMRRDGVEPNGRRPEEIEAECRALLSGALEAVLRRDPAHHAALLNIEMIDPQRHRQLLLNATSAEASAPTLLMTASQLAALGDRSAAATTYHKALELEPEAASPEHHLQLGELLEVLGDGDGAIKSYRKAVAARDVAVSPQAAVKCAALLCSNGKEAAAHKLYRRVAREPAAALALAGLLKQDGDEEAVALYREILDPATKHAKEHRAQAQIELAYILVKDPQEIAQVEELVREAAESDVPAPRQQAAVLLAAILVNDDKRGEAKLLLQRTVEEREPATMGHAAFDLATLLAEEGDRDAGDELCRRCAKRHPWVALRLGDSFRSAGREKLTEELYGIAAGMIREAPGLAAEAQLQLAEVRSNQGDLAGTEAAYWKAIESNRIGVVPSAAFRLVRLYEASEAPQSKTEVYGQITSKLNPLVVVPVARALGENLVQIGSREEAEIVYAAARDRAPLEAASLTVD